MRVVTETAGTLVLNEGKPLGSLSVGWYAPLFSWHLVNWRDTVFWPVTKFVLLPRDATGRREFPLLVVSGRPAVPAPGGCYVLLGERM